MGAAVDNAIASVAAANGYAQTYVNFTTKLVTDVMNALVASSISQMKAYAELVSQLESGLAAFKAATIPTTSIVQWVESNVTETVSSPTALTQTPKALSQSSITAIQSLYTKLVSILGQAPNGIYVIPIGTDNTKYPKDMTNASLVAGTITLDKYSIPSTDGSTATDYTDPAKFATLNGLKDGNGNTPIDLLSAVKTMFAQEATNSYKQLDTLVQMGFQRIVITDGHILTKMTFEMQASDASQSSQFDDQSSGTSASLSVGGGMPWLHASASVSHSEFRCKVANDHSQVSDQIHATMMGEVLVNYKSDYFPALPSQAKP